MDDDDDDDNDEQVVESVTLVLGVLLALLLPVLACVSTNVGRIGSHMTRMIVNHLKTMWTRSNDIMGRVSFSVYSFIPQESQFILVLFYSNKYIEVLVLHKSH